jgi:hypothetical protein
VRSIPPCAQFAAGRLPAHLDQLPSALSVLRRRVRPVSGRLDSVQKYVTSKAKGTHVGLWQWLR